MNCPACKDVTLDDCELEAGLPAGRCGGCGGEWVNGTAYLRWIEARGPKPPRDGAITSGVRFSGRVPSDLGKRVR